MKLGIMMFLEIVVEFCDNPLNNLITCLEKKYGEVSTIDHKRFRFNRSLSSLPGGTRHVPR